MQQQNNVMMFDGFMLDKPLLCKKGIIKRLSLTVNLKLNKFKCINTKVK